MKTIAKFATDDRGRIRRYVGFWMNGSGNRVQRPFFFGSDPAEVPSRVARVDELWTHIVNEWNTLKVRSRRLGAEPERREGKPVWSHEGLWIAQQLAAGKVQIVVPRRTVSYPHWQTQEPMHVPTRPEDYARQLRRLAHDWPMVYFVPDDAQAAGQGADFLQQCIDHQIASLGLHGAADNLLATKSETLHQAIGAYIKAIEAENVEPTLDGPQRTAWGTVRKENAERLKLHHDDCPLSTLDFDGCQTLIDYWRNRPLVNRKGRPRTPMSRSYCKHHVDELKRFFRWTSKSKKFNWKKPEDFEDLTCKIRDIASERTDISFVQVPTYSVEDLALLYRFGSDLQRLLMLLGLNCGFRGSEAGTTEERHVFLDGAHPNQKYLQQFGKFNPSDDDRFLCYTRHKSGVYGEWLLWPETEKAIRWGLDRKAAIGSSSPMLLVTKEGRPFFRRTDGNKNYCQIFANKWTKLTAKIRKECNEFPKRPFGTLRDTGSDFIRHLAGGEAAGCYLMHGSPAKDNLLDLYSNRPFGKVHTALGEMRHQLQPMFDACPDAFTTPAKFDD